MGEGTREVDYGRDIADLKEVVMKLASQVANLQRALEMNGTLYGGAVAYSVPVNAYSDKFVERSFPIAPDGFKTQFDCSTATIRHE